MGWAKKEEREEEEDQTEDEDAAEVKDEEVHKKEGLNKKLSDGSCPEGNLRGGEINHNTEGGMKYQERERERERDGRDVEIVCLKKSFV